MLHIYRDFMKLCNGMNQLQGHWHMKVLHFRRIIVVYKYGNTTAPKNHCIIPDFTLTEWYICE